VLSFEPTSCLINDIISAKADDAIINRGGKFTAKISASIANQKPAMVS
jgi:hypothetical protein